MKLWRNEFLRIFYDRLISNDDKEIVNNLIAKAVNEFYGDVEGAETILENPLVFGDFREIPKLIENYENISMKMDPENVCIRSYEELIKGNPVWKVIKR